MLGCFSTAALILSCSFSSERTGDGGWFPFQPCLASLAILACNIKSLSNSVLSVTNST